jgi:N-acyl-phosphatidylethanolamine-hydrolysing phospholipase D
MSWFFQGFSRRLFKTRHQFTSSRRFFNNTTKMSSASTSAALYAAVTSPAQAIGAQPDEAKDKRHHLKDGKGFINPWDSYIDRAGFSIGMAMIKYDKPPNPF